MNNTNIAFIGAGNMAAALIKGLISNGTPADNIWASDLDGQKLSQLQQDCGINISGDNRALARQCDVVVLAVKPAGLTKVAQDIAEELREHSCLLISIAAGITLSDITACTHEQQAIVRCMPNTPSLVGCGATGLYANEATSEEQRQTAETILRAVGTVSWLFSEQDIDAVTALSGSGPAYFFLLMEAMQEAAEKLGLDPENARELCLQTGLGAARLALESDVPVGELRRRVTSPGGTTEAALNQFEADGFKAMVERALGQAASRSRELAQATGKK